MVFDLDGPKIYGMKYMLIAGEASGDLHAARLIRALRARDAAAEFRFLGGDEMARAAGREPEIHYADMAFMGLWDVLTHLRAISRNLKRAENLLETFRPDALILVDYPGFNLRLARYAKERGFRVFYYITPKVWAWKEGRIEQLRRYTDRRFVILPFEPAYFAKHGLEVTYVGNPVKEAVDEHRPPDAAEFRRKNALDERPLVALLPGSRRQEIRHMLPMMMRLADMMPGVQFAIAGAPSLDESVYRRYGWNERIPLLHGQTYDLLSVSQAAVVTSGTATLETALLGVPQVVGYRTVEWQYRLGKLFVDIEYFSLVNLILNRPAVPELLQGEFNEVRVKNYLEKLLHDTPERRQMLADYADLRKEIGEMRASEETAKVIMNYEF